MKHVSIYEDDLTYNAAAPEHNNENSCNPAAVCYALSEHVETHVIVVVAQLHVAKNQ